jgi:hypothetical protein
MMLRAAAIASVLLLSQLPSPPRRIDPAAPAPALPGLISRAMAEADAQSFARALAEAGHAAGFIMPASERQGFLGPDPGHMLTLDEAVQAFTARGRYKMMKRGRTLVFRHAQAPDDIMTALDTPHALSASTSTFSSALFGTVLRSLARVRVGGTAGPEPGAGPECPVEQNVTLAGGRASTIDTLSELVQQTKSVGWLVRFGAAGERQRLQIGYVCGNGVWSALSVPGW